MTCTADDCDGPVKARGLCQRHYMRDWNQRNRLRRRELTKAWRQGKGREREAARAREWKRANRERMLAYNRAWCRTHPEVIKERTSRRRALKAGATTVPFTAADWTAIVAAQAGACAYCGDDSAPLTQDHVVPLSRGGDHSATNIVGACRSCNCRKRDLPLDEFLALMDRAAG